jgi:RNase H-like domain found in reverse transcriptase
MVGFPVQKERFLLKTDTSQDGLGGVLFNMEEQIFQNKQKDLQTLNIDEMSNIRIRGINSYKLKNAERNYSAIDCEMLAIVKTLIFFEHLFISSLCPIIIGTDHSNLTQMPKLKIARWRHASLHETLGRFNFKVIYTKGSWNTSADALSRMFDSDNMFTSEKYILPNVSELTKGIATKKFVEDYHKDYIHPGISLMSYNLKQEYLTKNLLSNIQYICKSRHYCQIYKQSTKVLAQKLKLFELAKTSDQICWLI